MTVKFRTTRRAALAGASALALAGGRARAQTTTPTPKKGGTLTFMQNSEPQTLVALTTVATPALTVSAKVTEGLLEYDYDIKPRPQLATEWTISPDGKTYTFKLRPEREIPRRQALHLGRRRLFDPAPEDGPSARPQHLRQRHRGQDARSADGGHRALQARALSDQGADGGRGADDAASHLRRHRSAGQSQRQCADRHRPLQVQGMGARQPHHLRAQPRLLGRAQALYRPHGLQVPARSGRALDRLRERLGRHRLSHAGGALRPRAAEEDPDLALRDQGHELLL